MDATTRVRRAALATLLVLAGFGGTAGVVAAQQGPPDDGSDEMEGVTLVTELNGAEEVDQTGQPGAGDPDGTGSATIMLLGETTVCWVITTQGITLPALAGHIHQAPQGVNGPIVVPLAGPNAEGETTGCVQAEAELVAAIAANPAEYYVNVHTSDFPAGAVRGQLEREPTCFFDPEQEPAPATITGEGVIVGTEGDDVIVGSDGDDTILGLGGHDIICGEGGNDHVMGGWGNDVLIGDDDEAGPPFGPGGHDVLDGGPGADVVAGLGGDDVLLGGDGPDTLIGFGGRDSLFGGAGRDTLFGGPDDDHLAGGEGHDVLWGNFGSDVLLGESGNDELDGDNPNPPLPPGEGPQETPDHRDTCLGGGGDDEVFNCELGDPSTPRAPQPPAAAPEEGDETVVS